MTHIFQLNYIFDSIDLRHSSHYIFINGHPVDMRNPKYNIFKYWYDQNKLFCFSCLKKITHFKLTPCKSDGSIHKKTGKRKHFLSFYADDGTLFTIDHWYPKSMLKKYYYQNSNNNKVPMCKECNREKDQTIPKFGRYGKTLYVPILKHKYTNIPFICDEMRG